MNITFLGATHTVTGSKYLLEIEGKKYLIDCGLFQGLKELRLRNWATLPIEPKDIDAVFLTHAHIDHSGYLPLLIKEGFKGPIYATPPTFELCKILLPDSGHLQEDDAKRANKYGYTKHHPAMPLYTEVEAYEALKQFKSIDFHTPLILDENTSLTWYRASHILGASFIVLKHKNKTLTFSGDVGRPHDPILPAPEPLKNTDYLILESTYGDRKHNETSPLVALEKIINETYAKGGTVLIPAFAVGRAQSLLYYIYTLKQQKRIPPMSVFLDSPMAIDATKLLHHFKAEHNLSTTECEAICHSTTYIQTKDESIAIDEDKRPKIIISASGMLTGGRVLHHLKNLVTHPKNTILLSGYQAIGTRGARLLNREPAIKIHGELYPVRAQIESLTNASAHADYEEILSWLKTITHPPKCIFITHGEPNASLALKKHIEQKYQWNCVIPSYLEKFNL